MRAEQKLEFSVWPRLTRSQDLPYFQSISFWSSSLPGNILEVTEEVVGYGSLQGEKMLLALSGCVSSCLVRFNSLQPHGLQPTRLLCPWNFSGKNTGVGCHFLPQRIFPIQGLILGKRRSPRGGNGNLLQYSCLENFMDRGDQWAIVHGVAKSQIRLSTHTHTHTHTHVWQ